MEQNCAMLPRFAVTFLSKGSYEKIKDGIDSVFAQDYNNIELVISHYGLEDLNQHDLIQYINSLSEKKKNVTKVRISTKERPVGRYRHLNQSKDLATGDYLLFMREGDVLHSPTVVSQFVSAFCNNPDAITISGFYAMIGAEAVEDADIKPNQDDVDKLRFGDYKDAFYEVIMKRIIPMESTAFRRKAFDFVKKFNEELYYFSEWSYFLNLIRQGNKPMFIDEVVTNHKMDVEAETDKKQIQAEEIAVFESDIVPYLNLFEKTIAKRIRTQLGRKRYEYTMAYEYQTWDAIKKLKFRLNHLGYMLWDNAVKS